MQCPIQTTEHADILLDYCARKLSPATTAAFERHLRNCEACSQFASSQQVVWSALDSWAGIAPSEDFDRKLYARIGQFEQSSWWNRLWSRTPGSSSWKPVMPVAAACATLVAAFLLYSPSNAPVVSLQESSRVETLEPEQVERTLEDLEMLKQLSSAPGSQSL
jgi:hypothetical protein